LPSIGDKSLSSGKGLGLSLDFSLLHKPEKGKIIRVETKLLIIHGMGDL
jgi:hypothetical protein